MVSAAQIGERPVATVPVPCETSRDADTRTVATSERNPLRHLAALDGLRGIAIVLVLWYHAPYLFLNGDHTSTGFFWRLSAGGWIGVDLFFVVSGFLITTILIRTRTAPHQLRTFWARRALRILPLAMLYLIVLGVSAALPAPWGVLDGFPGWPLYVLYLGNMHIALHGFQPLAVMILWSLSLEEQFYLVWPFMVRWADPVRLRRICAWVLILAPLARALVLHAPAVYVFSLCRADTLAAGALLAALMADPGTRVAASQWCDRLFVPAILVVLWSLIAPFGPSFDGARFFGFVVFGYSLLAAAMAVIVGAAVGSRGRLGSILGHRALTCVGCVCYGAYIWHSLIGMYVEQVSEAMVPGGMSFYVKLLIWLPCTALVVVVSWFLFERPILRLKRFFPHAESEPTAGPEPIQAGCKTVSANDSIGECPFRSPSGATENSPAIHRWEEARK